MRRRESVPLEELMEALKKTVEEQEQVVADLWHDGRHQGHRQVQR